MSFWPFPKKLRDRLSRASRRGVCVELGAGSGGFRRRLSEIGVSAVALDRSWATLRELDAPRVCATATRLPFAPDSAGLLTASNLWRHLRPGERVELGAEAARVLASGGCLLILEDSARARDSAEENYRECLRLLALADASRGSVCCLGEMPRSSGLSLVDAGEFENETALENPERPLGWLRAQPWDRKGLLRLDSLERGVRAHGMRVGLAEYQLWEALQA